MTRRRLPVSMFLRACPDCGAAFDTDRRLTHEDTCPAGRSLDEVTQADAKYFEDHPGEKTRVRRISHAEIIEWSHINGIQVFPFAELLVTNIAPGVRTRELVPWVRVPREEWRTS